MIIALLGNCKCENVNLINRLCEETIFVKINSKPILYNAIGCPVVHQIEVVQLWYCETIILFIGLFVLPWGKFGDLNPFWLSCLELVCVLAPRDHYFIWLSCLELACVLAPIGHYFIWLSCLELVCVLAPIDHYFIWLSCLKLVCVLAPIDHYFIWLFCLELVCVLAPIDHYFIWLSSMLTISVLDEGYHRVCIYSDTTGTTSGAGTAYPYGAHEFTPGL